MLGFFKKKERPVENPTSNLLLFHTTHRIDEMYLAWNLGVSAPTGEIAADIKRMCQIVEVAMGPLQMMALLNNFEGGPNDDIVVGYVFGWLDVFKSSIWQVDDFNRSFFHYGFLLWFSDPNKDKEKAAIFQEAMAAMLTVGSRIQKPTSEWMTAAQMGIDQAIAFIEEKKLPSPPK